jgi:alcohol dehydrogenase (cytochrome c)
MDRYPARVRTGIAALLFACTLSANEDFVRLCSACHGADAKGGERGPSLVPSRTRSPEFLRDAIRNGIPARGMPAFNLPQDKLQQLVSFIKALAPPAAAPVVTGIASRDPGPGDWPTYNGNVGGNRHSPLTQITGANVGSLAARWMFPVRDSQRLEVTPVVIGGVMYVTTANQVYALDATTGKQFWHFRRDRTKGLAGDAASGINRGVAILGDRVFLVTDHAHLLALNRLTGELEWDIEMADYRQNYGATGAPLVVNDLVISGVSGGDEGARGFIAAYRAATGEEVWRFWTVPRPGEPLSETWRGTAIEHPCSTTWLTGTYDPDARLLYWTAGNPCPDYNGDERKGDNLYSNSVLALNPENGRLKWYFQFTPHDLHDWDAVQTPMLIDAKWRGRPRKLLAQANRNGFFYVLDRLTGEFLLGKAFAKQTWAAGLSAKGRPEVLPGTDPTPEGVTVCPAVEGATNWFSPAFNPATGLFYVMALDKCTVYKKAPDEWKAGESFYGGNTRNVPGERGKKALRAINLATGELAWEIPQTGPANSWGGVLSTAAGLIFYCEDSGAFAAVDARTSKTLWRFYANQMWKASPMTYSVAGEQFVAIAAGSQIISFALPE